MLFSIMLKDSVNKFNYSFFFHSCVQRSISQIGLVQPYLTTPTYSHTVNHVICFFKRSFGKLYKRIRLVRSFGNIFQMVVGHLLPAEDMLPQRQLERCYGTLRDMPLFAKILVRSQLHSLTSSDAPGVWIIH